MVQYERGELIDSGLDCEKFTFFAGWVGGADSLWRLLEGLITAGVVVTIHRRVLLISFDAMQQLFHHHQYRIV